MPQDIEVNAIVEAFRGEARELLQKIGDVVLELENAATTEECRTIADTAFRYAHNIKGAAASLDLRRVEHLVHALEDVFAALQGGTLEPSADLVDALFTALDKLHEAAATVQPSSSEHGEGDREVLKRLSEVLPRKTPPKAARLSVPEPTLASTPSADPYGRPSGEAPPSAGTETFVRISQSKLDTLLAQVAELVEMKVRMEQALDSIHDVEQQLRRLERPGLELPGHTLRHLARGMEEDTQYLDGLLGEIRDELNQLRMVPLSGIFPVLRRAVRDVCRKQSVKVNFVLSGGDYQLDRKIVEEIQSPLVHLLRNAVYHGIEEPEVRLSKGKPPVGEIALSVVHQGNSIRIEVKDDGRGVDDALLQSRAAELGLMPQGSERLEPAELRRLLFVAGMSTSKTADTVAGRGVGLASVKRAVDGLQGMISIESELGRGTTFILMLPLTLATDTGLFVVTGGARFVIPRAGVVCVVALSGKELFKAHDAWNLWHAGQHVPIARLDPSLRLVQYDPEGPGSSNVAVILSSSDSLAAVVVDEIEGEAEVVVRSLGSFVRHLRNISGMTFGTSGEMHFVLNPTDLAEAVLGPQRQASHAEEPIARVVSNGPDRGDLVILVVDDSVTSRLLNQQLLTSAGFRVLTANDGEHALKVLRSQHCDLVLADVQMPHVDGYQLTRRLREDARFAQLPVILLTSLAAREDRERGIEAGADAYLVKREVTQAELVNTIAQLV